LRDEVILSPPAFSQPAQKLFWRFPMLSQRLPLSVRPEGEDQYLEDNGTAKPD